MRRPDVLIEEWLPLAELGIESSRERGASSALPPLYFLHVWWARRPLTVCRAAILASLLPKWSKDWPEDLKRKFPDKKTYAKWFLNLIGIKGDPIAAKKLIEEANKTGERLKGNPYGYKRAFTQKQNSDDIKELFNLIKLNWGTNEIKVCDPMAGGGSIPLEALRYGFTTDANDLNPVASVILNATLDYPARFGEDLLDDIKKYGNLWIEQVRQRLEDYYPVNKGESVHAYIWARTVPCPSTGKPVPLSPNWWLSKKGNKQVAAKLLCKPEWDECRFEIITDKDEIKASKPNEGTVKRGVGRSPWTGDIIDGDYIKSMAQEGRMGQQLYAIAVKKSKGFEFRTPNLKDLDAVIKAESQLKNLIPQWEVNGIIPSQEIPVGNKTSEPLNYGMFSWIDLFFSRQILAHCIFLEEYLKLKEFIIEDFTDKEKANAVVTYLAIVMSKVLNFNSRMVRFQSSRNTIVGTFDRHDFSFKWSHGEFDASKNLLPWALDQIIDSYKGIVELVLPTSKDFFSSYDLPPIIDRLTISKQSANSLEEIDTESVHLICVDPPYYDNVMYAELSDYFYVWMKRSLGDIYPEFFKEELTNKDEEAVANAARFASLNNRKKKQLAEKDYERKMGAAFAEMNRVLHPDGVLTVMFTHKRTEAWNTLATALIEAGFAINASWPVHTESEHSLHQANKNAAASTILLVCRKRKKKEEPSWWDEIKGEVQRVARDKAEEFQMLGVEGVDLYISTFGPVLSVISNSWPVFSSEIDEKTGKPLTLQPEIALDIAREEVVNLRKKGLLLGRNVQFDPITDWYIMAWDIFKAQQFPADEARKLALSLNLDLEKDLNKGKKLIRKKGKFIEIRSPKDRRFKGLVDTEKEAFDCILDAIHTSMLIFEEEGSKSCERFMKQKGLYEDTTFKAGLQSLIMAMPRQKEKGDFLCKEAGVLDSMRLSFFAELKAPAVDKTIVETQLSIDNIDITED